MPKPRSKATAETKKYSPENMLRVETVYYPWKTMQVGDEFQLRKTPTRSSNSVSSQVHAAGVRYGRKFQIRKTVKGNWIVSRIA
jgi:hypothetical protein